MTSPVPPPVSPSAPGPFHGRFLGQVHRDTEKCHEPYCSFSLVCWSPQVSDRSVHPERCETMNDLPEEMEPFAETIRDADVTTIAGLRAKTLIAVWDTYRLARNTMVTSVATMSRVIGLCLAALLALPGFPAWRRLFR